MNDAKGPLVVGNRPAAILLALTVVLLVAILLVAQPLAKNLLIGAAGGPVLWMLHLAAGTDPRIERPTFLRAAANVFRAGRPGAGGCPGMAGVALDRGR